MKRNQIFFHRFLVASRVDKEERDVRLQSESFEHEQVAVRFSDIGGSGHLRAWPVRKCRFGSLARLFTGITLLDAGFLAEGEKHYW